MNTNILRRIRNFICFLVVFFAINIILNFVAVEGTIPQRYQDYEITNNTNEYNLIVYGPSDAWTSFDTSIADDVLGYKTFNYGGNQTSYMGGEVYGTFINSIKNQSPQIVVCIVGDGDFEMADASEREKDYVPEVYIYSSYYQSSLVAKLQSFFRSSLKNGAIEKIFCWKSVWIDKEKLPSFDQVMHMMFLARSKEYWDCDIDWRNAHTWEQYIRGGFVPRNDKTDWKYGQINEKLSDNVYVPTNDADDVYGFDLEKIANYCKDKGIICVIMPGFTSIYDLQTNLSYEISGWEKLKIIADRYDAVYINWNLIKKEFYRATDEDWSDSRHLYYTGAEKYTKAFCKVIRNITLGKNIDDFFYQDYNEWISSYNE